MSREHRISMYGSQVTVILTRSGGFLQDVMPSLATEQCEKMIRTVSRDLQAGRPVREQYFRCQMMADLLRGLMDIEESPTDDI